MVTAVPAAADVSVASGARYSGAAAAVLPRTQLRRQQRRCHGVLLRARLEEEKRRRLAAEACQSDDPGEVAKRLRLAAPVLAAGLLGQAPLACDRRRRNAAMHCFSADAGWIAGATAAQLNRLQRTGEVLKEPNEADEAAGPTAVKVELVAA